MRRLAFILTLLAALATPALARANTVTDWNRTLIGALESAKTPPPPSARIAAIVQASVFDAVNGIRPRYAPYRVVPAAPRGASRASAAAGAAYEALGALFPTQSFDDRLAASLAQVRGSRRSIADGLAWGKSVADQILAWRADDGLNAVLPPYVPGTAPGDWQPTPPLPPGAPLFRQFAAMVPFALASPAQLDPGPPPALTSRRYARDLAEVDALGSATSTDRSAFDTQTAIFWQSDTPAAMWDRVADDLADAHPAGLVRTARVLARTDIAMADATIAIWNAKNEYDRWRPITAIAASGDTAWTPLLTTPAFQEYPAAHPGVSAAAASVLAAQYGERAGFAVTANGLAGVQREFCSLAAAVRQVQDARIFGGIHFRFATEAAARMGAEVGDYVLDNLMRRQSSSG
jgi:hypothetical protein